MKVNRGMEGCREVERKGGKDVGREVGKWDAMGMMGERHGGEIREGMEGYRIDSRILEGWKQRGMERKAGR